LSDKQHYYLLNGVIDVVQEISTINNRMNSMSGELLQIERSELDLLENRLAQMQKINSLLPKFEPEPWNLFRLFKRSSDELTHSYIMAYLFNPNLPHGLNDLFLQLFLEKIGKEATGFEAHAVEVETEVWLGSRIMDIIVDMGANVMVIENKIYASESPGQTIDIEIEVSKSDRYVDKDVFYIYLSPKGIEPENKEKFIPVSYNSIAEIIRNLTLDKTRKIPQKTYNFLLELLEHIEEEFEMAEGKWTFSERSRLYLEYQKDIDELIKSYENDMANIASGVEEVSRGILPSAEWKYRNSKSWQQVYKDSWQKSKHYSIHYETWLNSKYFKERKLCFMVDVEYAQKDLVLSKFDEDASIKEKLNKIGSSYRPNNRSEAIAYKEYKFKEDLSNIKEVLSKAFEEHAFLVDKIDEVVDKLNG